VSWPWADDLADATITASTPHVRFQEHGGVDVRESAIESVTNSMSAGELLHAYSDEAEPDRRRSVVHRLAEAL
jgi:hypothetical protein